MLIAKEKSLEKIFPFLLACCFAVNATALFSDIMGPDATLYASIAKQMIQKNDFINLFGNGDDWLDKPHLPFWLAACSYKIFGIHAFAYKLPNFFAYLLACFFIFKICINFFNKEIAQYSTLIFASSLHIALCNFDVRAEMFLTAFILAATYYTYLNIQKNSFKYLVVAAFFTALAIMCKGIFVVITLGAGFIIYWIKTKQWSQFLALKWYAFVLLIVIFIIPELYCLYLQFDTHPEKIVFGKQNVSGIKFFFWDSQFGRFFNNGPIKGSGEKLFFFHTTLWAFLPWSILLIQAAIFKLKDFKNNEFKIKHTLLFIINTCALVTFFIFNASKFQLPHYIVILFPHFSILAGYYLSRNFEIKKFSFLNVGLYIITAVVIIFITTMAYFINSNGFILMAIFLPVIIFIFYRNYNNQNPKAFVVKSISTILLLTLFLNCVYFPKIMEYQGGMMAGKFQKNKLPDTKAIMYRCNDYNFEFYGNSYLKRATQASELCKNMNSSQLFLGFNSSFATINKDSFKVEVIEQFPDFHISEMKASFINHKTRNSVLDSFYLATCTKIK